MNEEKTERIILPKQLQLDMLQFFLETSIPRRAKEKRQAEELESSLSENKSDRSD